MKARLHISSLLAVLLALLFSGCDRKKSSEATSTTESASIAAARADEDALRAEIGKGLEAQFNVLQLPVGDIEIMSAVLARDYPHDNFEQKRFRPSYVNFLAIMKQADLLAYVEKQVPPRDDFDIRRNGGRVLIVTPTVRARQHADSELSSTNSVVARIAKCEVQSIVRNSPYNAPRGSETEEYRLILGTYRGARYPWFTEMFHAGKNAFRFNGIETIVADDNKEYKFRAVVKLNPFTKRYIFQIADWGDPKKDGWETNNFR